MKIDPKDYTIKTTTEQVINFISLDETHDIIDLSRRKLLKIQLTKEETKVPVAIQLTGADYDAFMTKYTTSYGDKEINDYLINRFGLTII